VFVVFVVFVVFAVVVAVVLAVPAAVVSVAFVVALVVGLPGTVDPVDVVDPVDPVDVVDVVVTGVEEPLEAASTLVSAAELTGAPGESSGVPSSRSTTRPSPMANTTMAMPPTITRMRRNRSSPAGSPPIGGSGA
jgi:hypothetical protein